ncbi:superoxide dismutase [Peribacillus deserti]|uniref:superoxide dismutase n=1 Tax=Peribacillus deserti TaxID=673318 RepID=A0A2N5M1R0_9BACI|nr:superoxide dismutase [Peribacillus deserti]PLT28282.1 superoxide dismutase [Peribacillus deserti]
MSHLSQYAADVSLWIKAIFDSEAGRAVISDPAVYDLANNVKELAIRLEASEPAHEDIKELQRRADMLSVRLKAVQNHKVSVPIGQHKLPPLPYAYNSLEPVISEEIMRLHHDKHHKAYVDGLNKAEKMMEQARRTSDFSLLKHWEKEAAFHGSGHYLHTIFWEIMNPKGGGRPTGALLRQIEKDFGSFDAFKKHFSEAAKQVEGVGWALLVWSARSRKLEILQSEFHMNLTQWDTIPLLVLDVWEHAYYLQYKNNRPEYVENWWKVVYWPNVEYRLARAKQVQWTPF